MHERFIQDSKCSYVNYVHNETCSYKGKWQDTTKESDTTKEELSSEIEKVRKQEITQQKGECEQQLAKLREITSMLTIQRDGLA